MLPAVAAPGYDLIAKYGFTAGEAYKTARGGYGEITVIQPVQPLKSYTHIRTQPIRSAIGDKISPELLKYLNEQITERVDELDLEKSGGKTLLIRGKIIHLSDGVLEKYIVANIELLDADTHKSLGSANIEGKAEGVRSLKEAASGVGSGIATLLENHREN